MSQDPLDRYLDAFGARLREAAAAPRHRRRTRWPLLAATATATALALTALLLLLPGGTTPRRLDVIAEARAALAPKADELTHLVVRQRLAGPDSERRGGGMPPMAYEQWSATRPVRWRVTYPMPHNSTNHPGQQVEVAYARGVEQEYYPNKNHIRRARGIRDHPAPAAYPLGTDPVAALRALLARGKLRDAGTAKVGDREVRHLVGTRTRTFPGPKGRTPTTVIGTVEYDVDPTSYAPVRARIELPFPAGTDPLYVVLDFQRFERLPLTAESAKLLEVQPRPGATVTEIGRRR